jgi:hypothetical protein
VNQDLEQLRLPAIFHYVMAGLSAFFAGFPVLHLALGVMLLTGEFFDDAPAGQVPPELFGWLFVVIPVVLIILGWAFAIGLFLAGRFWTAGSTICSAWRWPGSAVRSCPLAPSWAFSPSSF